MTPSQLKYEVEQTGSNFFSRDSMNFFGDTMSNYGVRSSVVDTWTRENIEVWELWRKRPVKHGLQKSAYFDKQTFERVLEKSE